MENEKFKIADFSELIGTSPKTVYNLIKSGELLSEIEVQRGRKITLVLSNNTQIEDLQKRYGKDTSKKFQYYENETKITDNENIISVNEKQTVSKNNNSGAVKQIDNEILNTVIEYSKTYNDKLMNYSEQILNIQRELMNEKARIPLLEDKANREGLYLNEINELKKVNNRNKQLFTVIVSILTLLLITVTGVLIYTLMNPKVITQTETIIKEVPKEVIKYVKK